MCPVCATLSLLLHCNCCRKTAKKNSVFFKWPGHQMGGGGVRAWSQKKPFCIVGYRDTKWRLNITLLVQIFLGNLLTKYDFFAASPRNISLIQLRCNSIVQMNVFTLKNWKFMQALAAQFSSWCQRNHVQFSLYSPWYGTIRL